MNKILFDSGTVFITPGALEAIERAGETMLTLLDRHFTGVWGDLDQHDIVANEYAVEHGLRILSAFPIGNNVKIWIITEADRSSTAILLPSEY